MRGEAKAYEVEGLYFEFNANGSPYTGLLATTLEGSGTYTAEVNLAKAGSRGGYAKEAAELYDMDAARLKRALNEICTLRTERKWRQPQI
jgi:hypothetical protein